MSDKTHHIFSQNPKYGYLNSSMLIDMVTATINANVRQEIHLNKPKSKAPFVLQNLSSELNFFKRQNGDCGDQRKGIVRSHSSKYSRGSTLNLQVINSKQKDLNNSNASQNLLFHLL